MFLIAVPCLIQPRYARADLGPDVSISRHLINDNVVFAGAGSAAAVLFE
jgi:hypothetical protein